MAMTEQQGRGLGSSLSSHILPLVWMFLLLTAGVGGLVPFGSRGCYSCRRSSSIVSSQKQHQRQLYGLPSRDSLTPFSAPRCSSLATTSTTTRLFQEQQQEEDGESSITTAQEDDEDDKIMGTVLRTAFRKYDKQNSKPSGSKYTTKKDSQPNGVRITKAGVEGDYNHYRTLALKSTPDRAVCLWTTDVLPLLHSENYPVEIGDLGENLSLEGMNFDDFKIGHRYKFVSSSNQNQQEEASTDDNDVVIEITERTEPCANLCKLPYINEEKLDPKQRIQKCIDLIELLNQADGLRGWYAKVVREGFVRPGDKVVAVMMDEVVEDK